MIVPPLTEEIVRVVSKQHAKLTFEDGAWVLHDLNSANGTYVDGRRSGKNRLRPGSRIGLGLVTLWFCLDTRGVE
ncbi:MAG: FHA domain-containing protein [Chloroflexi bacterium]|nr:FHA domain-containing protein [Chloroflexota bacterium]